MTDTVPDFTEQLQTWAVLELMGHQREIGLVTTVSLAGAGFFQIDVPLSPEAETNRTRYIAPQAIYAINPCSREEAMRYLFPITMERPSLANPGFLGWEGDDVDPYSDLPDEDEGEDDSGPFG